MPWVCLVVAGILEICWAVGLKYTEGFSRLWPSVFTIGMMFASIWFLAEAVKNIPLGTGYAIWTGIGATGTAILGILLFSESAALPRMISLALIILGILGLKLTG